MAKRVPASMRTRESLSDLFEGRLSSADGRAALVAHHGLAERLHPDGTDTRESLVCRALSRPRRHDIRLQYVDGMPIVVLR